MTDKKVLSENGVYRHVVFQLSLKQAGTYTNKSVNMFLMAGRIFINGKKTAQGKKFADVR